VGDPNAKGSYTDSSGINSIVSCSSCGADGSTLNTLREVQAGDLDLSQSILQKNITSSIRINDSTFNGLVSFNYTSLEDLIEFSGSNFTKDASFVGTIFSGGANFDGAKFRGEANLGKARFSGIIHIHAKVYKGNENVTYFEVAYFRDATISGYFVEWCVIEKALDCNKATYLRLIQNFKDHGMFDLLGLISCGFGVRPLHTVYLGFILVVFFGFVYWIGNGVYKPSAPLPEDKTRINIIDEAGNWLAEEQTDNPGQKVTVTAKAETPGW
jgi:hypothetical protein